MCVGLFRVALANVHREEQLLESIPCSLVALKYERDEDGHSFLVPIHLHACSDETQHDDDPVAKLKALPVPLYPDIQEVQLEDLATWKETTKQLKSYGCSRTSSVLH